MLNRLFDLTFLLFSSCLLAASITYAEDKTSPPAPQPNLERAAPLERSQEAAQALERTLPSDERQTLNAGSESFLALWRLANTPQPQGTIVLIPGDGESADWPRALGPLRRKLPDAGWNTLSLTLPDPQNTAPQPRTSGSSSVSSADADANTSTGNTSTTVEGVAGTAPTAETQAEVGSSEPAQAGTALPDPQIIKDAYAERVMARIASGIDLALQRGAQQVILLGHGSGAYWAARYLAEREPSELHYLLMVDGTVPIGFAPPLEAIAPKLNLTIGDFFHDQTARVRSAAERRRQAAVRENTSRYTQISLKIIPGDPKSEQEQLYRRLRGWLNSHVKAATPEETP
ncbi:uncharacterized protein DUF3530 [Pseudomonas duriflava]|uniref:Uncharacterized protein DUF3530 n=1 Tax=Pseudomonas duriflava TaxID=459528 RepID=A0A562QJ66_9PSED|nr:alpha/beta hydrolase family protein [Pseudomonas duriflava]TWI56818.1 uncharacterized protein DUF3530 [Pseudomonas duriflava]